VDEFKQVQAGLGKPGTLGWWERLELPPEQAEALDAAGRDPSISHRAISIVLERWGVKVSAVQVGHWRRTVLGAVRR
jgi:hypothetical protein